MNPTSGSFSALPRSPNNPNLSRTTARKFTGTERKDPNIEIQSQKSDLVSKSVTDKKDKIRSNYIEFDRGDLEQKQIAPWQRTAAKSNNQERAEKVTPPPNSSALVNEKIIKSTANLISEEKYIPGMGYLWATVFIVLFLLPIGILIWSSYNNWPSYIPVPQEARLTVNKLIAQSPLTNTPLILLNPSFEHFAELKTFGYQVSLDAEHNNGGKNFASTITGKIDRNENFIMYADTSTSWWPKGSEAKAYLNNEIRYTNGKLEIFFKEASDSTYFHWPIINQKYIEFIINPTPDTVSANSPGEFALTKIRNKKISRLVKDFQGILMERIEIPLEDNLDELSPNYILYTYLTSEEIVDMIKEFMAIYQESQPQPVISQPNLEEFYRRLKPILEGVDVRIYVDKQTLLVDSIHLRTQMQTDKLPGYESDEKNFSIRPQNKKYSINVKMSIYDANKPVVAPPQSNDIVVEKAADINWPEVITHPWLSPLLQR